MLRSQRLKRPAHPATGHEDPGGSGLVGIQQGDRGPLGTEQGAGAINNERQDLLELQGRSDRACQLRKRFGLLAARRVVGEQPRIVDRDGGVVSEAEQGLLVAVGEDAVVPVGHREDALDPLVDRDRHRHVRAHALVACDARELLADPGVVEIVVGPERAAGREDQARGALAG